jgi:hypothetical protein
MEQVVTYVTSMQLVNVVSDALVTHIDLEPTLRELIHLPLVGKDLFVC